MKLQRLKYPYDLVHALMKFIPARCCVCSAPATRKLRPSFIMGDAPKFCDDHVVKDWHGHWPSDSEYIEIEQANLVRACNEYLNNTEQKT